MSNSQPIPDDNAPRPSTPSLVGDAHSAPALPQDLASELGTRLDAEFLKQQSRTPSDTLEELVLLKSEGWRQRDEAPVDAAQLRRELMERRAALESLADSPAPRGGRGVGWLLAAAACVLVCASFFSGPRYHWAGMIEAMRSQELVCIEQASGDSTRSLGSISTRRNDTVVRKATAGSSVQFADEVFRRGPKDGQGPLGSLLGRRLPSKKVESELLHLISLAIDPTSRTDEVTIQVDSRRPRIVEQGVELDVKIRLGEVESDARVLLDPHSNLPRSIEIVDPQDSQSSHKLLFSYPNE